MADSRAQQAQACVRSSAQRWGELAEIRVLGGELIIEDQSGDRRWAIAWRELVNAALLLAALRFIRATDAFSPRADPWRDEHLEAWLADYAL